MRFRKKNIGASLAVRFYSVNNVFTVLFVRCCPKIILPCLRCYIKQNYTRFGIDRSTDRRPGTGCKSSSILPLFFRRVLLYTENAIQKQKEKNTIRKDTAMYFNEQMFNPNTVNQQYYDSVKAQIEQYNRNQDKEILNAVKAIHDLHDAVKKLGQHRTENE